MPTSLVVTLALPEHVEFRSANLHGVASHLVESAGYDHHGGRKPFTAYSRHRLDGHQPIEINLLDDRLVGVVRERTQAIDSVKVGPHPAPLVTLARRDKVTVMETRPWESIVAASASPSRFAIRFLTPTIFRSRDIEQPFPLPGLVFGHLRDRWNAFAPRRFGLDLDLGELRLAVDNHQVESVRVVDRGRVRTGFVGEVVYEPRSAATAQRRKLDALGRFARFAGIGSSTTAGFGGAAYRPM